MSFEQLFVNGSGLVEVAGFGIKTSELLFGLYKMRAPLDEGFIDFDGFVVLVVESV